MMVQLIRNYNKFKVEAGRWANQIYLFIFLKNSKAILHRGLRNCFFSVHLLSIFYQDFYTPFLFGLLFP